MNLKLKLILTFILLTTLNIGAQGKLKGNKIVITQNREVTNFTTIEVMDNIDVYILQGTAPFLNVETDENLQEAVQAKVEGETLRIYLSEKIAKSTKLKVYVTVTESLHNITARKRSNLYADARIIVRKLTINAHDNSDFKMKLDVDDFNINGVKNTDLKFDIFSKNLKVNLGESSELKLEGEIETLTTDIKNRSVLTVKGKGKFLELTANNNGTFRGDNFKVDKANVTASSRASVYVNAKDKVSITAFDSAEIFVYNKPEIELKLEGKPKLHKRD